MFGRATITLGIVHILVRQELLFTAQRITNTFSAVYAITHCLSVCLSVRHKPVSYQNGCNDPVGFRLTLYVVLYGNSCSFKNTTLK